MVVLEGLYVVRAGSDPEMEVGIAGARRLQLVDVADGYGLVIAAVD